MWQVFQRIWLRILRPQWYRKVGSLVALTNLSGCCTSNHVQNTLWTLVLVDASHSLIHTLLSHDELIPCSFLKHGARLGYQHWARMYYCELNHWYDRCEPSGMDCSAKSVVCLCVVVSIYLSRSLSVSLPLSPSLSSYTHTHALSSLSCIRNWFSRPMKK